MSIEKAYNQWSLQYDTNKNRTRDMDKEATSRLLEPVPFNTILELGCGTGKNTEWLQTRASKILAVDFSEKMIEIAKTKISHKNIYFQKADITEEWKWASESFDLITCNLILEHIEDLDFIFSQAYSKLNKNGHFFISELHPFKQYKGTKAKYESNNEVFELETFTHHVSDFLNAAAKAGFQLKKLDECFDEDPAAPPRILCLLFQKS